MLPIHVAKFGGTSMASATAMQNSVARIAEQQQPILVVVSACAGVTNRLAAIAQSQHQHERQQWLQEIIAIHNDIASQLHSADDCLAQLALLHEQLAAAAELVTDAAHRDYLLSFGERCSSEIFAAFWRQQSGEGVSVTAASDWLVTDSQFGHAHPDMAATQHRCQALAEQLQQSPRLVTQGFIGANGRGDITTLGRGGSDYSAAVFAAALDARQLAIWTDVAGIYTTDPRICSDARPLEQISFSEAAELATFGAKVLHPKSLVPAIDHNIEVFVGHSQQPHMGGTRIVAQPSTQPTIRAVARRKNQTLLTVTSVDMLHATGFLARLFDVLARYAISVDLVTTSEVSIALTLDEDGSQANGRSMLPTAMLDELREFATVKVEQGLSLIAVIGNAIGHQGDRSAEVLAAATVPRIRLICQGASPHNLCFLVDDAVAESVVKNLHAKL